MNMWIQCAFAAAVLAAGTGAAMADEQPCSRSNWAEGYFDPNHPRSMAGRALNVRDPNFGWRPCGVRGAFAGPGAIVGQNGHPGYAYPGAVHPEGVHPGAVYPGAAYPGRIARPGDRDGDGVRDRRDRYPDDPRYR